jgi:GT2 family glycosyltransferase
LTAARGRNAGYAELQARYPGCDAVQFLDGDCILQSQWIPNAVEFLKRNAEAGVVCGQRFEAHPHASIYNALCDQEWDTPVGQAMECGGDALVRRSAFDQVGGFRSGLHAGEEPEMTGRMRAAGWEIWRIDERMTEHDANIRSFGQWWRRTQRGGYGYAQVWSATKDLPRRLYGRQLLSAFIWAVAIPGAGIIAALITKEPLVLLGILAAFIVQIVRIALRSEGGFRLKWSKGVLTVLGKIPETLGAARFWLMGGNRNMPGYKG